ncbi:filamentous hemagglutinin N-terminal domain-containing protein [Azoarcus indigens]|uniref:Filamentous hemagglutinin family protein n=1 Tax=Azoarcus indigens TaxID=29545 RepID=A0A4R6EC87_9RHOO|nr:filamentous haemagglutinin family protein [Azoarcus indigens]NMG64162.1 filamentous hemagglutinin N-terminal domain-containing protein [Azoarcus indigens]TDN55757.1 filamentous hemagglutinin family protein [Azoarcus indigens]
MSASVGSGWHGQGRGRQHASVRMAPLARALALGLAAGALAGPACAQQAFSSAWFAAKGAMQSQAAATGLLPNGQRASTLTSPQAQRNQASEQLGRSIENLGLAAQAIAMQQAAQAAARRAAQADAAIADGLAEGGLKVDSNSLTAGWLNAQTPVQTVADGRTTVTIQQTADKAILNWETFNVGSNTTVDFVQDAGWAVLNRVNDPLARPSQILGRIEADGTVMIVNRNGVIFSGGSQIDVRNLVAAAARITDSQFSGGGLYVDGNGSQASFYDALGAIQVEAGAQLSTHAASSATSGGGYVLLLGAEVANAGQITTPGGQTVLAAGDSFHIRKGVGTDGNAASTTRGNEVSTLLAAGSAAGRVLNTGLITASTGDITLTGHEVVQDGVLVATTATAARGSIHLSTRLSDASGSVTLGEGSTTTVLLEASTSNALDSQRDAALEALDGSVNPLATGNFDNLSTIADRADLSRIEIVSGGTVAFEGDSLTLATGGQVALTAASRSLVEDGARIDVSGAVGVQVSMASNNLVVDIQGNEQRDSPVNREAGSLNSTEVWVDRRSLVYVPAGTNGYETDRWYTAGGLLEVSGYLATSGHTVGEWMAQGGIVTVTGGDLVTRAGSEVNLSGGTLDVATGLINMSWLKGADGVLYEVSRAPADVRYTGLYRGYEDSSERWGVTDYYYNPLIAPKSRLENGYTVGRDAGKLVVATRSAVLEGDIRGDVYQGSAQTSAAQAGLDGYYQSQTAVARAGQLIVGNYLPIYDADQGLLRHALSAVADVVELGVAEALADGIALDDAVATAREGRLLLASDSLSAAGLGAARIAAKESVAVNAGLEVAAGGEIVLYAPEVDLAAGLTARSGSIHAGNVLSQPNTATSGSPVDDVVIAVPAGVSGGVHLHEGVTLDASGLSADLREAGAPLAMLAYRNGGSVSLRSTHDLTLEADSLVDVSAGALIQADGSISGGRGGSVTLGAGLELGPASSLLTLDGTLRGYGVNGAGTLDIESASAISVGGELLETEGLLVAGESVPVELIAAEDFIVRAGEILPQDYSYSTYTLGAGMSLPNSRDVYVSSTAFGTTVTLAADWTLPASFGIASVQIRDSTGKNWRSYDFWIDGPPTIPAGTVLTTLRIYGASSAGWSVPADVFPDGLPLNPLGSAMQAVLAAGTVATEDLSFAAGSRLVAGATLARDLRVAPTTTLSTALFQSGFAAYEVRGHNGLVVPDALTLEVLRPVLRASALPAVGALEGLLTVWTPPLYEDDALARQVTQRAGASLSLAAGLPEDEDSVGDGGGLSIGHGALLQVDPGEAIALSARGQLTVEGTLRALSGSIALTGAMNTVSDANSASVAQSTPHARSVLLGEQAVLDASAAAHVAYDSQGRAYGLLGDGGSIVIGGQLLESESRASASDAFVVINAGAVVDASGGQARFDVAGSGPLTLYSAGGSIDIASSAGIYLDGSLRAAAGGEGASGGRLAVSLEAPSYLRPAADAMLVPRELLLEQNKQAEDASVLEYGHARLGVDQVQAGGFSTLALYSNGTVAFAGDLDLAMSGELRIHSGALVVAEGALPSMAVSLSAPYLLLGGLGDVAAAGDSYVRPSLYGGASTLASAASLSVSADLIDIQGSVTAGLSAVLTSADNSSVAVERAGFASLMLNSQGDIRFVPGTALGSIYDAELMSAGDIFLHAAQVYPATGVQARVMAGLAGPSGQNPYREGSRIVISRAGDEAALPALPYSVFGNLTLGAAEIEQGGVLRAPLGTLTLGTLYNNESTVEVALLPGSVTSVSAAGLVLPYGGTADGVSYSYLGEEIALHGLGSSLEGRISLVGQALDVAEGAVLDLSGGGELLGAGFISGRGGSTDARLNPLVRMNADGSFSLPGLASNPVYAIVPGYTSSYAPAAAGSGAIDPLIGQQITIPAGVPGLPAGTYTLLPSDYALLPGAYRVELNGGATVTAGMQPQAMRNGSYAAAGTLATANTAFRSQLAQALILTPAAVLRTYSQYNETSYADFIIQQAALDSVPRGILPADGKSLILGLTPSSATTLNFAGSADFSAAAGGYGGSAAVTVNGFTATSIEVVAADAQATAGFSGITLHADDLAAIGAPRLVLGGSIATPAITANGNNEGNYLDFTTQASGVVLREGAMLSAPEVFLVANGDITVEAGAGINTLGAGAAAYDSTDGYVYRPRSTNVLALSNGWLNVLGAEGGSGSIFLGACPAAAACGAMSELYSEGTLLAAAQGDFELGDPVRYGTRNLVLAVGSVNAGSAEELAAAAARGALTAGMSLNQGVLDRLLQGDQAYGAPALERLVLTAAESINFFGDVALDTRDAVTGLSVLDNLVLSAPAIYGYGAADQTASISTGTLTWVGLPGGAPAPVSGGRGSGAGTLRIDADVIEFGYGPQAQPNGIDSDDRLVLGFGEVQLNAAQRLTANHSGGLAVYQRLDGYVAGEGYHYSGGNLIVSTPLVTGGDGSVNSLRAGGELVLQGLDGQVASGTEAGIGSGAELALSGQSVRIDTRVALPSGKLTLEAEGDILLEDGSVLDLAGRKTEMFDTASYGWGGDLILHSTAGDIRQAAGSLIDLSALNNSAGSLVVRATGEAAGTVDLQGNLLATASGRYDAGGTELPFRAGEIEIHAQHLGGDGSLSDNFADLNRRLNEGGWSGARSFQLKHGDLTIGNELRAGEITVSVDRGSLTVAGTVDASGERVGSIRLAARDGLTLAAGAVLDTHGSALRVDSYGEIIDSPNRAIVELDAGQGLLSLGGGVRIDLRHGTGASSGDGQNRGTLELYAARLGSDGSTTAADAAHYGDIAIDAGGNIDIQGASSIAVYGRQIYADAAYGSGTAASGRPYQVIDQAYLDGKHAEAELFMNAALHNANLLDVKLAGLNTAAYASALHLRPAVEIVSATADGDLVVQGDLDLSGYRYASLNPATARTSTYGSGEVGALAIRAGGDLSIYGSINDGFAPPPTTPDDAGWVLLPGVQPFDGDVLVPVSGVQLAAGTVYPAGKTLNYAITAANVTLPAGTTLPQTVTLGSAWQLPAGTVLGANVLAADGSTLLAAGTAVEAGGLTLPSGARLGAGTRLPVALTLASLNWPKGVALPVAMTQQGLLTLPVGAVIPAGTNVKLVDDALQVSLRPVDSNGQQARNWALASMLPEGSQSWSLRLVAGADTAAADRRQVRPGAGDMILADSHYGLDYAYTSANIIVWADGNWMGYPAGDPVSEADLFWCDVDPSLCAEQAPQPTVTWADGNWLGYPVGGVVDAADLFWCDVDPSLCVITAPQGDVLAGVNAKAPALSVLRTGTGDLDLAAGGSLSMQSPYGVYTAGSQTSLGDAALDALYDQGRGKAASGTVLGSAAGDRAAAYEALVDGNSLYQAWYPDGGGNLWIAVEGNLTGDSWGAGQLAKASSSVGNWLWRQGGESLPTAWWINFGTYAYDPLLATTSSLAGWPAQTGFTGFGTLGGGNATIRVGGDAGIVDLRSTTVTSGTAGSARSQGVVLAVGSSGRVLEDGSLVLTGGGDLDIRIGGGWNAHAESRVRSNNGSVAQAHELYGAVVNLRGAIAMEAGSIGTMELIYGGRSGEKDPTDTRIADPYGSSMTAATGGLMLVEGDASACISSRGDLVFGGTADAGRVHTGNYQDVAGGLGLGWFSLWSPATAVDLLSAGGNLALDTRLGESVRTVDSNWDFAPSGGWYMAPSSVNAVASSGSIYYGASAAYLNQPVAGNPAVLYTHMLLAPSTNGSLQVLAADSIYAGGFSISRSGAEQSAMAGIRQPAYALYSAAGVLISTNVDEAGPYVAPNSFPLLTFGANTTGASAGLADLETARFYAVAGDIVGLRTGVTATYDVVSLRAGQTDYIGAGPVALRAGRDIVSSGMGADAAGVQLPWEVIRSDPGYGPAISGNLIVHGDAGDVSVVSAGRDILYANFDIAGPGTLEISAGRNIVQNDVASITSIGAVVPGDRRAGADIALLAGLGAQGADYAGFLARYLDKASLATTDVPLAEQEGKVVKVYEDELVEWLKENEGYSGSAEGARSYFATLAPERQAIFARLVYFAELRAGGREYNDADGPRPGSYLRGRQAIAALFPEREDSGYQGDLLIYGGAGVHTDFGGSIQVLTPGGGQTYGVEGAAPPASAGLITQGQGDIQLYARDSILLGQSRVMTTFGGDILGWSAEGDINAGRGAKTTVVFTPPKRVYDNWGNVSLSSDVPSTGAGIATLAPIAEVPAGDVDLIAPLGTIDAGEAGIRVSGSVNLAASQVLNAANIDVKGEAAGIPMAAAVNVSALSNASAATSSAASSAQEVMQRERVATRQALPSIFTVRVIGFGNEAAPAEGGAEAPAPAQRGEAAGGYDSGSPVQVLGHGQRFDPALLSRLTDAERRSLRLAPD